MTRGERWTFFDVLALAQHLTGNTASAVETQRRAFSLLPAGHPQRTEYEQRVAGYEAALAQDQTGAKKEDE